MPINKITWLTDIHLNFLEVGARAQFYQTLNEANTDAILITGDIAEANSICELLTEFSMHITYPIYFVLGNHDYYAGSVIEVREKILSLCMKNSKLIWLGKPEIIQLNRSTLLVGQDGWADARYGDFEHSTINLNDSQLIAELSQAFVLSKSALKIEMQKLADTDAFELKQTLIKAINAHPAQIIIATHVPPFTECCWHKENPSDENWLPYFASKASGDVISTIAQTHPEIDFLVLCGHTHTECSIQLFANLKAKAGKAQYYYPCIQEIITI